MTTRSTNKIRGALYGVAVADALGGPLEFMTANEIARKHGRVETMIGGGWLNLKPGEVTDDTQMTFAVAEGIINAVQRVYGHTLTGSELAEKACLFPDLEDEIIVAVGDKFIKWYESNPKDIGNTCRVAIGMAIANINKDMTDIEAWKQAAIQTDKSLHGRTGGNGTLMRTVYPALYFHKIEDAIRAAKIQSDITHPSKEASQCCAQYTSMIHELLTKEPTEGLAWLRGTTYALSKSLLPQLEQSIVQPTGYVLDSFAVALQAVNSAMSFKEAVCNAVNRGGDADTIGAIAGGLAGAIWGYDDIPKDWIHALAPKTKAGLEFLAQMAI